MSTKSSIAGGEQFHFYTDLFDTDEEQGTLYLQLRGTGCCEKSLSTTAIPPYIWGVIRRTAPPDLSLLGISDEDLLAMVTAKVDAGIAAYATALAEAEAEQDVKKRERNIRLAKFCCRASCDPTEPREEQITALLERYKRDRGRQNRLAEQMSACRVYDSDPDEVVSGLALACLEIASECDPETALRRIEARLRDALGVTVR